MKKTLNLLFVNILAITITAAQHHIDDKYATEADLEREMTAYKQELRKNPLKIVCWDSLPKDNPRYSQEWLAAACTLKNMPRWAWGGSTEVKMHFPRQSLATVGTDMNPEAAVQYELSSGINTGFNLQFFLFSPKPLPDPFMPHPNTDSLVQVFSRNRPFASIYGGIHFETDYFEKTEEIDLLLTDPYLLSIREDQYRIALPIGFRWNINLDKKQKTTVKNMNINKKHIKENSLFFGLGLKPAFLADATRLFYKQDSINGKEVVNWSDNGGSSNLRQSVLSLRHKFMLDTYAEFGLRFCVNKRSAMPQYISAWLRYFYPFLSNIPSKKLQENETVTSPDTKETDSDFLNTSIYSTGHRDLERHLSLGYISFGVSMELHVHKIK